MLSATLQEGLARYAIGERVRGLRLKKKMGLVELGRHTGLSAALLSKIERGRLFPTLPTLLRIALVFGVDLDFFFAGPREKPLVAVMRGKDRVRLPERPEARQVAYRFGCLDYLATERPFSVYEADFYPVPPDRLRPHAHPGVETLYVLKGRLAVHMGADVHLLDAGDSMYFDSTLPHAYRRAGGRTCSAVVVTSP